TLCLEPSQNFVDQRAVFDDEQVGVENGSVFGADRFRDSLLHLENLHPRLHKRGLEPSDLVSNLRRFNVITGNVVEIVADDMNDAACKPRRDARSAKPDFLVIAAHPRAILYRTESSLKRAVIDSS